MWPSLASTVRHPHWGAVGNLRGRPVVSTSLVCYLSACMCMCVLNLNRVYDVSVNKGVMIIITAVLCISPDLFYVFIVQFRLKSLNSVNFILETKKGLANAYIGHTFKRVSNFSITYLRCYHTIRHLIWFDLLGLMCMTVSLKEATQACKWTLVRDASQSLFLKLSLFHLISSSYFFLKLVASLRLVCVCVCVCVYVYVCKGRT
jgi:hypothetical protein